MEIAQKSKFILKLFKVLLAFYNSVITAHFFRDYNLPIIVSLKDLQLSLYEVCSETNAQGDINLKTVHFIETIVSGKFLP